MKEGEDYESKGKVYCLLYIRIYYFCMLATSKFKYRKRQQKVESGKWYPMERTNIKWKFDTSTKTLTIKVTGAIPGNDDDTGLPWSQIDDVKKIIIGEGITEIGEEAFATSSVSSIVFPDSLREIGFMAFCGTRKFKKVKFPKNLYVIGDDAFCGGSLTTLELPKHLSHIGNCAFYNCDFKEVVIPESVDEIGYEAFEDCAELEKVTLPKDLKVISMFMFRGCTNLKEINFPNKITKIEDGVFYDCTSLKRIEIPNSVSYIGEAAFSNCKALEEIKLPNKLKTIHKQCFMGCISMRSIELPQKLCVIGENAFSDTGLKTITIPQSVTKLKGDILNGCFSLKKIKILSKELSCIDKNIIRGVPYNTKIEFPKEKKDTYGHNFIISPLSGNYEGIEWRFDPKKETLFFHGTGVMNDQGIINGTIEAYPWEVWNKYIKKVEFEGKFSSIGSYLFYGFINLKEVKLSNSIGKIGYGAFQGSGLEVITIPCNVTTLEDDSFCPCPNLKKIVIKSEKLDLVAEHTWRGLEGVTIIAPESKRVDYEEMFKRTNLPESVEVCYK